MTQINLSIHNGMFLYDSFSHDYETPKSGIRINQIYCEFLYRKKRAEIQINQLYLEVLKKRKVSEWKITEE